MRVTMYVSELGDGACNEMVGMFGKNFHFLGVSQPICINMG